MRVAVIICAAGASSRFGPRSKLDEDLGGRPVLHRAVELFTKTPEVSTIVVAGPREGHEAFRERHADRLALLGCTLCRGGERHRFETVREALAHVPEDATHVAVHDAARPCVSPRLIERCLETARTHPAVVPAVAVRETLKRVGPAEARADADPLDAILGDAGKSDLQLRAVAETLPREGLVLTQTPQVFDAALLRRAYEQDDLASTDDAELVERLGEPVVVIEGEATNVKITLPEDLHLVRRILGIKDDEARPTHKRF